jgi:hypothetical protein
MGRGAEKVMNIEGKKIIILIIVLTLGMSMNGLSEGDEILMLLKKSPKKGLYRMLENRYDVDISGKKEEIKKELNKQVHNINMYVQIIAAEMLLRYYGEFDPWNALIIKANGMYLPDKKLDIVYGSILRMGFKVNELIDNDKIEKKMLDPLYYLFYDGKNFTNNEAVRMAKRHIERMKQSNNYNAWKGEMEIMLAYPDEDIIFIAKKEMEWFKNLTESDKDKLNFSAWDGRDENKEKIMRMFRGLRSPDGYKIYTSDYFIKYEKENPIGKTLLSSSIEQEIYEKVRSFCNYWVDTSDEAMKLRELEKNALLVALDNAGKAFSNDKNVMCAVNYAVDMIKNDKIYGGSVEATWQNLYYLQGWEKSRLEFLTD